MRGQKSKLKYFPNQTLADHAVRISRAYDTHAVHIAHCCKSTTVWWLFKYRCLVSLLG